MSNVWTSTKFEKQITGNHIYGFVSILDGGDTQSWAHARANFTPFLRYGYGTLHDQLAAIVEDEVKTWRSERSIDLMPKVLRLVIKAHLKVS